MIGLHLTCFITLGYCRINLLKFIIYPPESTIIEPKRSYMDERRYEGALYTRSRTCAT